jgi:hypothetical protein
LLSLVDTVANGYVSGSGMQYLNAGDVIREHCATPATMNTTGVSSLFFRIVKVY